MLQLTFFGNSSSEPTLKECLSKQSYTYDFEEGQAHVIANNLMECGLIANKEQLFDCVTVSAMQKAAGITMDKMLELYHDGIVIKPKERTLKIK